MKNIIAICLLTCICSFSYAQNKCEKFKIGKFQNIVNGVVNSEIERTNTIQIEEFQRKKIKLKITWIDDCSYRLKFLEGNEAYLNGQPKGISNPD